MATKPRSGSSNGQLKDRCAEVCAGGVRFAEAWEGGWEADARESVEDDRGLYPAIPSYIYTTWRM